MKRVRVFTFPFRGLAYCVSGLLYDSVTRLLCGLIKTVASLLARRPRHTEALDQKIYTCTYKTDKRQPLKCVCVRERERVCVRACVCDCESVCVSVRVSQCTPNRFSSSKSSVPQPSSCYPAVTLNPVLQPHTLPESCCSSTPHSA